jgi:ferredoxin
MSDGVLERTKAMSPSERQAFWKEQLSRCIKCYGCRDACPVCICAECELERDDLVGRGRLPPDFPAFQIIRAYHLAGRCVHCGECERACPMGIPLRALHDMMRREPPARVFELVPGIDEVAKLRIMELLKASPLEKRKVRK